MHRRLHNVYGDDAIDKSNVRRWIEKFKGMELSIEDKSHSGKPSTAHLNYSRVVFSDGSNASLVMEMLNITFVKRKSYSTNR